MIASFPSKYASQDKTLPVPLEFHKKLLPISDFWVPGDSNAFPGIAI
jgi:hypothetical protein